MNKDILCDIFGYHIWLQSDAAFYYPRLDKYSFSVGNVLGYVRSDT